MCNCDIEKLIKKALGRIGVSAIAFEEGVAVVTLEGKGVRPLFDFIDKNKRNLEEFHGLYWGDRVVGKASAMLFLFIKPKFIYGEVISESAIKVFEENDINFSYGEKVPFIKNKDKTDSCPFEKAVLGASSKEEAFGIIKSVLESFIKPK